MTSCYTTKVVTSSEKKNDIAGYLSILESGDKIIIKSKDSHKYNIQFLASNGNTIKGFDLKKSPKDPIKKTVTIDTASIKKIKTQDVSDSIAAVVLIGLLGWITLLILVY